MSEFKAELESGLAVVQGKLDGALEKMNAEVETSVKASKKTSDEVKFLAEEFAGMKKDLTSMNDSMVSLEQKSVSHVAHDQASSLGGDFVASEAFSSFVSGASNKASASFQNNTIVTGGDNSVTRHFQLPGVVPGAFRQLTVMPTVAQGTTNSNIIYYSRELSWTNNAAGTAEGAQKPESVLTFEEIQEPVRTIPHFIKASRQALEDSTFLSSYIDSRMAHGVRNKIESQIINGDGTGQNFGGWLAAGNSTVVSGAGTSDIFGATNKIKQTILSADYIPDYFYFNPVDWATVETIRRGTGDSAFVGGDGGVLYYPQDGMPPRLWGIPVVISNNVPAGTIICKSMDADMYFSRNEVRVEMFEQDDTNVQSNLVTIRAEARGAEAVMVPAAIASLDVSTITA